MFFVRKIVESHSLHHDAFIFVNIKQINFSLLLHEFNKNINIYKTFYAEFYFMWSFKNNFENFWS